MSETKSAVSVRVGDVEILFHVLEPAAADLMTAVEIAWHALEDRDQWGAWIVGGGLADYLSYMDMRPGDKIVYRGPDEAYLVERQAEGEWGE